jgi:hypothetical protein
VTRSHKRREENDIHKLGIYGAAGDGWGSEDDLELEIENVELGGVAHRDRI